MSAKRLDTKSAGLTHTRHGEFIVYHDAAEASSALVGTLLPDPDRLLAAGQLIESPWQSAATDKAVVMIAGRHYFFKRYNCLGAGYRLKNMFRTSRALKSWWAGWKFLDLGLSTPKPVACLEERRLRLLGRSYLIFEFLDGSRSLLDRWPDLSRESRPQLLALLGSEIGKMHRFGLRHGDLNWRNILVRGAAPSFEIYFVDLDGSSYVKRIAKESARQDLSHFFRDLKRNQATEQETEIFMASWENAFRLL